MYCGQCGKKVMDNMLFCPFCGSPIVIPEQDEPAVPVSAPEKPRPAPAAEPVQEVQPESVPEPAPAEAAEPERPEVPEQDAFADEDPLFPVYDVPQDIPAAPENKPDARPASLFDPAPPSRRTEDKPEEFVPLSFDFDAVSRELEWNELPPEDSFEDDVQDALPAEEPVQEREFEPVRMNRRPAAAPRRADGGQTRPQKTYIPVKDVDPNDMFMDGYGDEEDDPDDYDLDDARGRDPYGDMDFDYEEPESGSFFQRHIRGIVGLILLLVMLLICGIWAFSPNGQKSLAQINLAWTAKPYADLGYAAYKQDSHSLAARYYAKAFSLDSEKYEYAHSAMVAYYDSDDIDAAARMLKKCIELAPDNPEPYQEMMILYPDPASRPWEVSELIRLGYQRTGDESLNLK